MTDIEDQGSWGTQTAGMAAAVDVSRACLVLTVLRARHAKVAQSKAPVPVWHRRVFQVSPSSGVCL
jgi:hypothetical protein